MRQFRWIDAELFEDVRHAARIRLGEASRELKPPYAIIDRPVAIERDDRPVGYFAPIWQEAERLAGGAKGGHCRAFARAGQADDDQEAGICDGLPSPRSGL